MKNELGQIIIPGVNGPTCEEMHGLEWFARESVLPRKVYREWDGAIVDLRQEVRDLGIVVGEITDQPEYPLDEVSSFRRPNGIFYKVELPAGWTTKRIPDGKAVLDERGRERIRCSYKPSPYDRRADARVHRFFDIQHGAEWLDKWVEDRAGNVYAKAEFSEADHPSMHPNDTRRMLLKWLDNAYPSWRDPAAYWNSNITPPAEPVLFKPFFTRSISCHGKACVQMEGASEQTMGLVRHMMLDNFVDSTTYQLRSPTGAFLQGFDESLASGWFLIEFWCDPNDPCITKFIEHMNERARDASLA